jgi:hypothetical protein
MVTVLFGAKKGTFFAIDSYWLLTGWPLMGDPMPFPFAQVQTLRWRLYHVAGKVVRHGRRLILKVSDWVHELLAEIRARSQELACAT